MSETGKNTGGGRRIIALDIGTVRIGVAASDPLGMFAQGIAVIPASGEWMEELSCLIGERGADTLLVGFPRRTDGLEGPEAVRMKKIIEDLSRRFPEVDVTPWDERFTTAIATQALIEADVSRKERKGRVDKVAAALLLQSYLDSLRPKSVHERELPMPGAAVEKPCRRKRRERKNNYDL